MAGLKENCGQQESQILVEQISFNPAIDYFPILRRKLPIQFLFQIIINGLVVGGLRVILNLRVKTLAAVGNGAAKNKDAHGTRRLFHGNFPAPAKTLRVMGNTTPQTEAWIITG